MTRATISEALRRLYIDAAHTDNAGHIVERIADPAADLIDDLVREGARVMALLSEHGGSIVPHLVDSDDNAGKRFRDAISRAEARAW